MARRRKTKEAPIETLFKAPWWVSIIIGVMVLVVLKWIVPSGAASNPILKPMAAMLSTLAWLFSGVFFFVGMLSFARQKFSASKPTQSAAWSPREPSANRETTSGWQTQAKQQASEYRQEKSLKLPVPPSHVSNESEWQSLAEQRAVEHNKDRVFEAWEASISGATQEPKPTAWSIELLRELEWKRFEDVCQKFYESKGIKSETTPLGPDGGIDIRLFQDSSGRATSIVQCKAWGGRNVGIKPVRELLGVMAHEKIDKAFFMASGNFTDDAKAFAQGNRITLINGDMLVTMMKRLPESARQSLLVFATEGDFTTPTCPSCGIKMRRVAGTNGRPDFWGCQNYPRCRQKLGMRAACR